MTFADFYQIEQTRDDDWFDPILLTDTLLFIDPLLISQSTHPLFVDVYDDITSFFSKVFELAARCAVRNDKDLIFRILHKMVLFPEVEELCLGYSRSTKGSGSAKGFAEDIVKAIFNSIDAGLENIDRFENIGLFSTGIGRDRISDITANILKKYFVNYTQSILERHPQISSREFTVKNFEYNFKINRWITKKIVLPINPYNNKGVILCPKIFLNDDSFLSKDSFKDYIWDIKNQDVRDEFSFSIKAEIDKQSIINIAKKHLDWVKAYNTFYTGKNWTEYNLEKDKAGVYLPLKESFKYADANPLKIKDAFDNNSFHEFSIELINYYQHFIENNSGYKLLWNDDGKYKKEEAAQLIFVALIKSFCKANNIDLTKEVNLGRGPVDFRFSQGYENRASIEVKLAKNSHFWNGVKLQLPKYLEVEDIKIGYFIVICYNEDDFKKIENLENECTRVSKEIKREIIPFIVDATNHKPSASKLV
ncbi:hypothetical protein J2787_003826 [Chryseobacterium rhizosphaerae]|uniref:Uncharacterized protein n=1 Tax=Chryseobacterium rhizosphaerae TaxID=395937 RepID=A0AAE3YDK8_9FLAO|nr:hypothetical protein [Chryseobacterium rhizosphaerae]MDR6528389.1 hypothetical protein [Chryseobacterium rhizosphaerae]